MPHKFTALRPIRLEKTLLPNVEHSQVKADRPMLPAPSDADRSSPWTRQKQKQFPNAYARFLRYRKELLSPKDRENKEGSPRYQYLNKRANARAQTRMEEKIDLEDFPDSGRARMILAKRHALVLAVKRWRVNNPHKVKAYARAWLQKPKNREKHRAYQREYQRKLRQETRDVVARYNAWLADKAKANAPSVSLGKAQQKKSKK